MKRFIVFLLSLFFQLLDIQAQNIQDLEKSYVFLLPIYYEKDGINHHANLLIVTFLEDSTAYSGMNHSAWFLVDSLAGNRLLGASFLPETKFPISVYDVKISTDNQFLAVFQVAEGHPYIEIIDVRKLINAQYEIVHFLNPYPGSIEIVNWENNLLIVESDMPLTDLNNTDALDYQKQMEEFKKYSYDPRTKKYTIYNK
jgi:hypothetical protein